MSTENYTTFHAENPSQKSNRVVMGARSLVNRGFNVIPIKMIDGTKKPIGGSWTQFQDVAMTPDQITRLPFGRADSLAIIHGAGTTQVASVLCLDIDARKSQDGTPIKPVSPSFFRELHSLLGLPADYAWAGPSQSGAGFHIWIDVTGDMPPRWQNKAEFIPTAEYGESYGHIEVRINRHYTMIPAHEGFIGYSPATLDAPLVSVSADKLAQVLTSVGRFTREERHVRKGRRPGYVKPRIESILERVANQEPGGRNDTLFNAAIQIGQLLGRGMIEESDAEARLLKAGMASGLPFEECEKTIQSGFSRGNP